MLVVKLEFNVCLLPIWLAKPKIEHITDLLTVGGRHGCHESSGQGQHLCNPFATLPPPTTPPMSIAMHSSVRHVIYVRTPVGWYCVSSEMPHCQCRCVFLFLHFSLYLYCIKRNQLFQFSPIDCFCILQPHKILFG